MMRKGVNFWMAFGIQLGLVLGFGDENGTMLEPKIDFKMDGNSQRQIRNAI